MQKTNSRYADIAEPVIASLVHTKGNRKGLPCSDKYKKECRRIWNKLCGELEICKDSELWRHLTEQLEKSTWSGKYKATCMGMVKSVTNALGIEQNLQFNNKYGKLCCDVEHDANYKELNEQEIREQLECEDKELLTIPKLQQLVIARLAQLKPESPLLDRYVCLLLSFFAFHGHRAQDFVVGYGRTNATDRGFYCPIEQTIYLWKGKTQADGTRKLEVDLVVAMCIDLYHYGTEPTLLLPQASCTKNPTGHMQEQLKKHAFGPGNCFGLPKKLCQTKLRHLFESYLFGQLEKGKLSQKQYEEIEESIGHSCSTAMKKYACLYRLAYQSTQ